MGHGNIMVKSFLENIKNHRFSGSFASGASHYNETRLPFFDHTLG